MAEDISLQDFFDDEVLEMIEKQFEYLQKLPIEPTVANPVYTNGQTEETKHVEEASSSVCLDDEMFVDHSQQYLYVSLTYF